MHTTALILGLSCLTLTSLSGATTELFENFDSATPDTSLGEPWVLHQADDPKLEYLVKADTQNLFGKGEGNNFLYLRDGGSQANIQLHAVIKPYGFGYSGQVEFTFYDPGISSVTKNANGLQLRLSTSDNNPGNSSTAFMIFLTNGAIYTNRPDSADINKTSRLGEYAMHQPHSLILVFNNGTSAVSYDKDRRTLESGTMDVWLDGVLIASGIEKHHTAAMRPLKNIAINGQASGMFSFFLDDIAAGSEITWVSSR
ncbi:hypothetical protein H5P28_17885 [Ruficoccus amylovorans]|uniref:Uncharacterized protein n=1 Tax=Ruficoccus amylovorans TaxID=1804625 RepID=A0A842HIA4_9BACT|nr:hypothetical protein [Ruficoccus amylovorans]MBC2596142.1 hypothetical protein [Ruficoccus amylovorans]